MASEDSDTVSGFEKRCHLGNSKELPDAHAAGYSQSFCLDDVITSTDLSWVSDPDRPRSLVTEGCEFKSPVASNELTKISNGNISNDSLAISSEGNTASEDDDVRENKIHERSIGISSNRVNCSDKRVVRQVDRSCFQHSGVSLDHFCNVCCKAICRQCAGGNKHRDHDVTADLSDLADLVRQELSSMSDQASKATQTVDKAIRRMASRSSDQGFVNTQLDLIEEEIKATETAMIKRITDDTRAILLQVARLKRASSCKQLEMLQSKIEKYTSMILAADEDDEEVVKIFRQVQGPMRRALLVCAEGGAVDRIQDVEISFKRKDPADLMVGQLKEETGWQSDRRMDIPWAKRGQMQGMTSLPGGRLAVGYQSGGVDIFNYSTHQEKHPKRILEGTKIGDLVSTAKGTVIIYPLYGDICEFTADGKKMTTTFDAPASKEHVSLSRTSDGRIFMGYPEHNKIYEFHRDGGSMLNTTSAEGDFKPQQIDLTKSGKIVAKDIQGIRVLDQESHESLALIKTRSGQLAYATCDRKDNIYVAMVTGRDNVAAINMHRISGDLVESVTKNLSVSPCGHDSFWLRLVSISHSLLAVCDGTCITIFRRMPSITELANELELL